MSAKDLIGSPGGVESCWPGLDFLSPRAASTSSACPRLKFRIPVRNINQSQERGDVSAKALLQSLFGKLGKLTSADLNPGQGI